MSNRARIVSLQASNVMRLSAIEIEPDGSVVTITGKNKAGKTCVMECISMVMGGLKLCPKEPIRKGQDSAVVRAQIDGVELGPNDSIIAERTFKRKKNGETGSSLKVTTTDGYKAPQPQAILDALYSKLTFDPLAFTHLGPKEQANALKSLVGLDFAKNDKERALLYDERTLVNRDAKSAETQAANAEHHPDAPEAETDPSTLTKEIQRRREHNHANEQTRGTADAVALLATNADASVANQTQEVESALQKVTDAKAELEAANDELMRREEAAQSEKDEAKKAAAAVRLLEDLDVQEAIDRLAEIGAINSHVQANLRHAEMLESAKILKGQSEILSGKITAIDDAKAAMMAGAEFPVDGLGFDADGVTLNGLPFEQASQAEQLRVSVAMGLALNPDFPVLLIRTGSLLDEDEMKLLAELAKEHDAQIWIERVGVGEVGILIEDGHVKGQDPDEVRAKISKKKTKEAAAEEVVESQP